MGYWRAVRNRIVNLELIGAEFTDPQRPTIKKAAATAAFFIP